MAYRAPLDDLLFAMRRAAGDAAFADGGLYADLSGGVAHATLEEAAKFAEDLLAPLDRVGDIEGVRFSGGEVTTASGWRDAYFACVLFVLPGLAVAVWLGEPERRREPAPARGFTGTIVAVLAAAGLVAPTVLHRFNIQV